MTGKRGPGRPPITGEARPEILRVRVTEDERALFQAAADDEGQPLARWMHTLLVAAAKKAAKRRQR